MPWKEVTHMEELIRFVTLARGGQFTITDLCGVSWVSNIPLLAWLLGTARRRWPRNREAGPHGVVFGGPRPPRPAFSQETPIPCLIHGD